MATPYDIVRVGSAASTQDIARSGLLESSRPTLVLAERQTAGRGRMGRTWDQPDRAVFSSFAFESNWASADRPLITLCTAVVLAETIEGFVGVDSSIKWPNDLLVSDHKVAGILVESTASTVTVGCGVNLWWPDAPSFAGALLSDDPGPDLAIEVATGWVDGLIEVLAAPSTAWPRDRYLARSWTIGRDVSWDSGEGSAKGIDEHGGLIVATDQGECVVMAGEVHVLPGR